MVEIPIQGFAGMADDFLVPAVRNAARSGNKSMPPQKSKVEGGDPVETFESYAFDMRLQGALMGMYMGLGPLAGFVKNTLNMPRLAAGMQKVHGVTFKQLGDL